MSKSTGPKTPRLHATPLTEATTANLIAELKRRSLACVIGTIGIAENNHDSWQIEGKGSKFMIESLLYQLDKKFMPERDDDDGDVGLKAK